MDFLYEASQIAYQVLFFDNSVNGEESVMFAHFKRTGKKKKWDDMKETDIPNWFFKYYIEKIKY